MICHKHQSMIHNQDRCPFCSMEEVLPDIARAAEQTIATKTVDESEVREGDILLLFAHSPWGTARVNLILDCDASMAGYRQAMLKRPYLYESGHESIETYSVYFKHGRTVRRFINR